MRSNRDERSKAMSGTCGKLVLGAALVALMWPASALAGGFQSTDVAGRGGPTAASARGLTANPGTMGLVEGTSTDFDLQLALRPQSFARDGEDAEGQPYDTASSFTARAYPEFAHVSSLGVDWFRLGFALELPFRYSSDWPTDGAQRYHSIFEDVTAISLSPAVGFRPTEWLSVGASVSYQLVDYRSYRAFDFGPLVAREEGVDPQTVPSEDPGNEGRESMEFIGEAFGWSAGAVFTPGDLRIGVAYHSPVNLELDGTYELFIPKNQYYQRRYVQDVSRSAQLNSRLPSEVRAGVSWAFSDKHRLWADVAWTHWSIVDEMAVEFDQEQQGGPDVDPTREMDWNDTFEVRGGGRFPLADTLDMNAEAGFETSAIPNEQLTARVIGGSKVMGSVGLDWQLGELLTLHAGYQHVFHFPRSVEDSEATPPADGDYMHNVALVNTGLSYRFR